MNGRTALMLAAAKNHVDIAALLAQDAPICMLDEVTNDLDLRHQVQILSNFASRAQKPGHLNLFILHDINLALQYCSHALMIFNDGRIETGELPDCLNINTLTELYGCGFSVNKSDKGEFYLPIG